MGAEGGEEVGEEGAVVGEGGHFLLLLAVCGFSGGGKVDVGADLWMEWSGEGSASLPAYFAWRMEEFVGTFFEERG